MSTIIQNCEIQPPSADTTQFIRPALDRIEKALKLASEDNDAQRKTDGLLIMQPWTNDLAGLPKIPHEEYLEILHHALLRCHRGENAHPHEPDFPASNAELALAMLLARAGDVPPHNRITILFAENNNPWNAPRTYWRIFGAGASSHPIGDPDQNARWAKLAPPKVSIFLKEETPESIIGPRITVGLYVNQSNATPAKLAQTGPVARLRAEKLLFLA